MMMSKLGLTDGVERSDEWITQVSLNNYLTHDNQETYLGYVRSDIVGIRYYDGKVSNHDMVALVREPENPFDPNAVKILNMASEKVGYIKRKHAAGLAIIMDKSLARLEGTIPYGADQYFQIPIHIRFWGSSEKKDEVLTIVVHHGMSMIKSQAVFRHNFPFLLASSSLSRCLQSTPKGGTEAVFRINGSFSESYKPISKELQYPPTGGAQYIFDSNGSLSKQSSFRSQDLTSQGHPSNSKTGLTPQEMENEFGKIFDPLDECDNREETEPSEAVSTALFPYQKQALNWMISKENSDGLPPFWEELGDRYWNTVAMVISNTKPKSVHGGILADDMGLGKSLEIISLIFSNFVDDKPLAYLLPGTCRLPFESHNLMSTKLKIRRASSSDLRQVTQTNSLTDKNFHRSPSLLLKPKTESPSKVPRLIFPGKSQHETTEESPSELDEDTMKAEFCNSAKSPTKRPAQDSSDDTDDDQLPDIISPLDLNKKVKAELPIDCDHNTGRVVQTSNPRGTLIICPLSVVSQWLEQFEAHVKKTVHILLYVYHGPHRNRDIDFLKNQDVVITTYSTLTADLRNSSPLHKVEWLRIVLDEGHIIRNPSAQQTLAVYRLEARRRWILTGTPIQNSVTDFWSMLNFLQVEPFKDDEQLWKKVIAQPLSHGEMSAVQHFGDLMRSLALRRTKKTNYNGKPLVDLPARIVKVKMIHLSEKERDLYDAMESKGQILIRRYAKGLSLLSHFGRVWAILMRLRQLCCHPQLVANTVPKVNENDDIEHMDHLMSVLLSGADLKCTICSESLNDPVISPCAHVYCRLCIEGLMLKKSVQCPVCCKNLEKAQLITAPDPSETHWIDSEDQWQPSSKTDALMQCLTSLRESEPRVKSVVVSQFTSFLTLLEKPLRTRGFNYCRFDGSLSAAERTDVLKIFSETHKNSPTVLLLSLNAGGVGLNLTAASRVFLMEPAWNPAAEEQCIDRCHRIGQVKDVITTKFITENSIEERMVDVQQGKKQLMRIAFDKRFSGEQNRMMLINEIKALLNLT